jgi:molecular chaperone DnaJ
MASKRDYYEVLGINRNASPEEIKKAFRRKARQFHPDVSSDANAEGLFKEANEAYDVLSDTQKRAAYDRFGHAGLGGMPGGGSPFDGYTDINDIFADLFGGFRSTRTSRKAPRRGQDLEYHLTIEFEDAVFGGEREIEFERTASCPHCNGNGAEPGTGFTRCSTCNGAGEVRSVRQTILGQVVNITTCPQCQGNGEVVSSPCHECRGQGRIRAKRRLTVTIPAGVDHGTQIRISGEGEPGSRGGPPGNLDIVISVRPHKYFRRRNHDLIIKLQVNVAQAALGTTVNVPILSQAGDTTTELRVPAGTQSGQVFVIKSKGVPRLRHDGSHTGYGDLQVVTEVEIPARLTPQQKALFEQLGAILGEATIPPAAEKGFMERVLDWLGGQ